MSRGEGEGVEAVLTTLRSRAEERDSFTSENVFSWSSSEEAQSYAANALRQSGARPGDTVIVRLTSQEQLEAGFFFAEAAAAMGLGPVRALTVDYAMSDEELADSLLDQERQLSGKGVSISLQSFAASPFEPHDDHWQERSDSNRQASIDRINQAGMRAEQENTRRWNVTMWPTREWSKAVFPESDNPEKEMAGLLARATFSGDPEGLKAQQERLRARQERLTSFLEEGYSTVAITTPAKEGIDHPLNRGTDLRMEICPGSRIASTHTEDRDGNAMNLNNPTDEVYGTPIRSSVEGHFTTTRPYVTRDEDGEMIVIDGIYGEFENGKLVRIESFDPRYQEIVERDFSFNSDPPTDVLGELGLVDSSGALAQAKHPDGSPRTFFNNIMDENTGVHIGFGKSFTSYTGGEGDVAPVSGSNSIGAHLDLVIGNERTSVTFLNDTGDKREAIRSGLWQDD